MAIFCSSVKSPNVFFLYFGWFSSKFQALLAEILSSKSTSECCQSFEGENSIPFVLHHWAWDLLVSRKEEIYLCHAFSNTFMVAGIVCHCRYIKFWGQKHEFSVILEFSFANPSFDLFIKKALRFGVFKCCVKCEICSKNTKRGIFLARFAQKWLVLSIFTEQ